MKNMNKNLTVIAVASMCGVAQAEVIAAWDFQTTTNGGTALPPSSYPSTGSSSQPNLTPKVYASNFGSGTLYLDGTNFSSDFYLPSTGHQYAEILGYEGTTLNLPDPTTLPMSDDTTGNAALYITAGRVQNYVYSTNGKSMVFKFSMTGYADLTLSYATKRMSFGHSSLQLEYSTDGAVWTSIGNGAATSTFWGVRSFSNMAGLDGASDAYIRMTLSGATTSGAQTRLDNIILSANAVPAPGAAALLGLAGLIGRRRKA